MKNKFIATLSDDCQLVIVKGEDKEIAKAYNGKNPALIAAIINNDFTDVTRVISNKDIKATYYDFVSKVNIDKSTGKYNAKISVKNTRFGKGKVTCLKSDNFEDKDDENDRQSIK